VTGTHGLLNTVSDFEQLHLSILIFGRKLPPYDLTPMTFLFQVAKGDKVLIKDTEIKDVEVVRFREFGTKKALELIKARSQLRKHEPEEWSATNRGSR
jgi:hypothetical protein